MNLSFKNSFILCSYVAFTPALSNAERYAAKVCATCGCRFAQASEKVISSSPNMSIIEASAAAGAAYIARAYK